MPVAKSDSGVVIAIRSRVAFVRFGAEARISNFLAHSVTIGSGPAITASTLARGLESGIGAEIQSKRITELVDALVVATLRLFQNQIISGIVDSLYEFIGPAQCSSSNHLTL